MAEIDERYKRGMIYTKEIVNMVKVLLIYINILRITIGLIGILNYTNFILVIQKKN